MELRREVVREVRLVGLGVTLALIVIGLIGLVEKGPVIPSVPVGSSPLSPLSYGTFSLYEIARSSYNTVVVVEPRDVFRIRSSRCVYIVISPSKPVERDRASEVLELLKKACSSTAVLIADEEPTSTGLLEALNSSIRIVGNRVGLLIRDQLSYHPEAAIILGQKTYRIVLDLASEVVGGRTSGYVTGLVVTLPMASKSRNHSDSSLIEVRSLVPVAAEERLDDVYIYVVGDGSIFVNQVLNSDIAVYREFARDLLNHLCGGAIDCAVVFDARYYESVSPLTFLSRGFSGDYSVAEFTDLVYALTALFVAAAHPAFWLPPLFKVASEYVHTLIFSPLLYLLLPAAAFFTSQLLLREESSARDRPIGEQQERDVFIATELRKSILSGAVKLDSRDFINLYDMVNLIAVAALGVKLSDNSFPKILSRYVGESRAFRYWKKMNKLYRRAAHRTLWPPVVLWRRSIVKALDESEEILNALGESLLASVGLERLVLFGGSHGVSS